MSILADSFFDEMDELNKTAAPNAAQAQSLFKKFTPATTGAAVGGGMAALGTSPAQQGEGTGGYLTRLGTNIALGAGAGALGGKALQAQGINTWKDVGKKLEAGGILEPAKAPTMTERATGAVGSFKQMLSDNPVTVGTATGVLSLAAALGLHKGGRDLIRKHGGELLENLNLETLAQKGGEAKGAVDDLLNKIKEGADEGTIGDAITKIKGLAGQADDATGNVISGTADKIKGYAEDASTTAKDYISNLRSKVTGAPPANLDDQVQRVTQQFDDLTQESSKFTDELNQLQANRRAFGSDDLFPPEQLKRMQEVEGTLKQNKAKLDQLTTERNKLQEQVKQRAQAEEAAARAAATEQVNVQKNRELWDIGMSATANSRSRAAISNSLTGIQQLDPSLTQSRVLNILDDLDNNPALARSVDDAGNALPEADIQRAIAANKELANQIKSSATAGDSQRAKQIIDTVISSPQYQQLSQARLQSRQNSQLPNFERNLQAFKEQFINKSKFSDLDPTMVAKLRQLENATDDITRRRLLDELKKGQVMSNTGMGTNPFIAAFPDSQSGQALSRTGSDLGQQARRNTASVTPEQTVVPEQTVRKTVTPTPSELQPKFTPGPWDRTGGVLNPENVQGTARRAGVKGDTGATARAFSDELDEVPMTSFSRSKEDVTMRKRYPTSEELGISTKELRDLEKSTFRQVKGNDIFRNLSPKDQNRMIYESVQGQLEGKGSAKQLLLSQIGEEGYQKAELERKILQRSKEEGRLKGILGGQSKPSKPSETIIDELQKETANVAGGKGQKPGGLAQRVRQKAEEKFTVPTATTTESVKQESKKINRAKEERIKKIKAAWAYYRKKNPNLTDEQIKNRIRRRLQEDEFGFRTASTGRGKPGDLQLKERGLDPAKAGNPLGITPRPVNMIESLNQLDPNLKNKWINAKRQLDVLASQGKIDGGVSGRLQENLMKTLGTRDPKIINQALSEVSEVTGPVSKVMSKAKDSTSPVATGLQSESKRIRQPKVLRGAELRGKIQRNEKAQAQLDAKKLRAKARERENLQNHISELVGSRDPRVQNWLKSQGITENKLRTAVASEDIGLMKRKINAMEEALESGKPFSLDQISRIKPGRGKKIEFEPSANPFDNPTPSAIAPTNPASSTLLSRGISNVSPKPKLNRAQRRTQARQLRQQSKAEASKAINEQKAYVLDEFKKRGIRDKQWKRVLSSGTTRGRQKRRLEGVEKAFSEGRTPSLKEIEKISSEDLLSLKQLAQSLRNFQTIRLY